MKHLYTLKKAMSGGHSILNNKIFYIKQDPAGHAHFYDAQEDSKEIWMTSTVEDLGYTAIGLVIKTKNTVYDLVDLATIIPTTTRMSVDENLEDEDDDNEPTLIDSNITGSRAINYGDGYTEIRYIFDRALTENEMRAWLAAHDKVYKMYKDVPWYEDYAELSPGNNDKKIWLVKTIHRYTD